MQGVATAGVADQLLVAAQSGDQFSFAQLIEPHIHAGYCLAVSMLNDRGLAEDVVQEATLRAWRGVRRLSSSSRIRPWYLRIVANRCRSLRATRWWSVILQPMANVGQIWSQQDVDAREDLTTALRRLNPEDRAAIYLRFFEDLSSQEVGEALGISATGARSRISRALRRLRIDLAEEGL